MVHMATGSSRHCYHEVLAGVPHRITIHLRPCALRDAIDSSRDGRSWKSQPQTGILGPYGRYHRRLCKLAPSGEVMGES